MGDNMMELNGDVCRGEIIDVLTASQLVALKDDVRPSLVENACIAKLHKDRPFELNLFREHERQRIALVTVQNKELRIIPKYPLNMQKIIILMD